jgi:hypothetical protein
MAAPPRQRIVDCEYCNDSAEQTYAPHPILHATPPDVLQLRAQSAIIFLESATVEAWQTINDLVVPTLDLLPQQDDITRARVGLCIAVLCQPDPFMSSRDQAHAFCVAHQDVARRVFQEMADINAIATLLSDKELAPMVNAGIDAYLEVSPHWHR